MGEEGRPSVLLQHAPIPSEDALELLLREASTALSARDFLGHRDKIPASPRPHPPVPSPVVQGRPDGPSPQCGNADHGGPSFRNARCASIQPWPASQKWLLSGRMF